MKSHNSARTRASPKGPSSDLLWYGSDHGAIGLESHKAVLRRGRGVTFLREGVARTRPNAANDASSHGLIVKAIGMVFKRLDLLAVAPCRKKRRPSTRAFDFSNGCASLVGRFHCAVLVVESELPRRDSADRARRTVVQHHTLIQALEVVELFWRRWWPVGERAMGEAQREYQHHASL